MNVSRADGRATASLLAALATTGAYAGANLLSGLVRNKSLAVLLGPGGFGEWSQVMSFFYLLQTGAALGVTTGVARYVAEYRRTGRNVADVFFSAGALVIGVGVLLALAAAAAAPWIAPWVVGKPGWSLVFVLTAVAIPLVSAQAVLQAGLQGYGDFRGLAGVSVGTAAAALAAAVGAAAIWGARGVAAYVVVSFAVGSFLYGWRILARLPRPLCGSVDRALLRGVLSYGGVALIGTVLASASALVGRSLLLHTYGPTANGYYQAMSGLTLQILPIFLSGIALYTIPRLGGLDDGAAAAPVLARAIRLVVPVVAAGLALGVVLREAFFGILFTTAFAPAAAWFPVQLTGDLLLALAWAAGAHLLPMGRLRTFLLCEVLRAGVFLGSALALLRLRVEPTGAAPLAFAHLLSYAAEAAAFLALARHANGLRLRPLALPLGLTAVAWAAVVGAAYTTALPWRLGVWGAATVVFTRCAFSTAEIRAVTLRLANLLWRRPAGAP